MQGVPAYGRDYTSKAKVLADWNENKDFMSSDMFSRGYFNKQDAENSEVETVQIRYKKLTQVCILRKNKKGEWK